MKVLRERNGQAILRVEDQHMGINYEWWFDIQKMRDGIRLEEKNNKTYIYCHIFKGKDKESWIVEEFDRRVPRVRIV